VTERLAGRVAVITGGGSGIGLASVCRLAREGASVVVADVNAIAGQAAADEVGGLFVLTDVTSEPDVEHLFAATHERYGTVDVAFNNAGISPPDDDSILVTGLDAWRRVQDVNLTSVYQCCKAVIPYMQRQARGSIINTASFVAVLGAATSQISYTASKGGVVAMSRELGVQFAREGIRVNALCPGPVNTSLLRDLFAADAERAQRRLIHVPMDASRSRPRSRPRWRFWPATTPRSSPRRRSWWTVVSPAPTSPRYRLAPLRVAGSGQRALRTRAA
jgi:NAD(P)-dependent dehydrogenase (short-subunit alcohol dehydrogenase family)